MFVVVKIKKEFNVKKRIVLALGMLLLVSAMSFAADPKIDGVIAKIRDNQNKIQDLSANISTKLRSDTKDKKSLEQKGSIMIKGADMSRMEMSSPIPQLSVTNKDKMMMVNPATGQKMVQDLKKLRKQTGKDDLGQNPLDQTRILDYFNLSLEEKGIFFKSFVLSGTPKDPKKFAGTIKFYVDESKYVPTKIEIYNQENKLVSLSNLSYTKIKDIWVVNKNSSWIVIPNGKMYVDMKFENIKINEGISDKAFEIK